MARKTLCVTDLGTGFCYDTGTDKINAAGSLDCADILDNGANEATPIAPTNIVDADNNVTTPDVNGNIPFDTTGNVGYVLAGKLRVPGGDIQLKGTTYNTTPAQAVGSNVTTGNATYSIPLVPYNSYVVVTGRQILATSYSTGGSTHQIRMQTNVVSTGPAMVPAFNTSRDVITGGGSYTGDSAELYAQYYVYVPANTATFDINANCRIEILGLTGTTSASGTSGIFTVQRIPRVAGGIV